MTTKKHFSFNNFGAILSVSFLLTVTAAHSNVNIFSTNRLNTENIAFSGRVPKMQISNEFGSFFEDLTFQKITIDELTKSLNESLALDNNHSFREIKRKTDQLKMTHVYMQHYYKGMPIDGELVLIHAKGNLVQSVNGQVSAIKDVDVTETRTAESAFILAKQALKVTEAREDYPIVTVLTKTLTPEGKVAIKVAKKVRIDSFDPLIMVYVYVEEATGFIVKTVNLIHDADVDATGQTIYRGRQNITADSFSEGYRLRDNTRNIETYDATNARFSFSGANFFRGYSDLVSPTTSFSQSPAVDAHWGMSKTYDYYMDRFGRDSYDGQGSVIKNYYNPVILEREMDDSGFPNNAAAYPAPYNLMVYGRGDGVEMGAVVGLDVTGHEFTHMVVEHNGANGLEYRGESGALNESFADIFGTAVEFYVNLKPNWLIGENIMLRDGAMRSMMEPKRFSHPNTYKGQYWINTSLDFDNGGVHFNSGVQNFWFYLLSEGGNGTNDLNNNYNVNGIGLQKAEKIAYRNLTNYLTNNATFLDAFKGSLQAAKDLYGESSPEYEAVGNAWYAVGIGNRMSVNASELKSNLRIYPNPANGGIVNVYSNNDGVSTLAIYDLLGKEVVKHLVIDKGENAIDVKSLSNGVYFLKFSINGQMHSEKLMINN